MYDGTYDEYIRSILGYNQNELYDYGYNDNYSNYRMQDNIAIVEESGPKVEVSKPDINPIISEPKEEENDDDWFNIPLPPPNPIESLEEDEIEEEPVKIVNVERPKQPESDFKMIDELLKSTKTYSLEDIVHELKNVVEKFNKKGFHLNLEEKDFENNYQVIINIEKDK